MTARPMQSPPLFGALSDEARAHLASRARYHAYLLRLYGGTPLYGLHGQRADAGPLGPRSIHICDAAETADRALIEACVSCCRDAGVSRLDVLAFEFAPDVWTAVRDAARQGICVAPRVIPREVMEPRTRPGDVVFRVLPRPRVDVAIEELTVTARLAGYEAPLDDVPPATSAALGDDWRRWIDGWMVDWTYDAAAGFCLDWHAARDRRHPLSTWQARHVYATPGRAIVAVRVVDVLGCETTDYADVEVSDDPAHREH